MSKLVRRLLIAALALCLVALPERSNAEDQIAGVYDVLGTNDRGNQYRGTAEIFAKGSTYQILWLIGESKYGGRGVATKTGLAFAFVGGGFRLPNVVLYERAGPGVWCGIWTTDQDGVIGQETLTLHVEGVTPKAADCSSITASRDGVDVLDRQVAWDDGNGHPQLADELGRQSGN